MVDNRSAGFFGIGGSFNFKSGDISGTAAKTADDRQSPGMDYFVQEGEEEGYEQFGSSQFVDRSAQLKATLNSLAMNNVASVLNAKRHKKSLSPFNKDDDLEEDEEKIEHYEDVFKEDNQ